jgi:hypothetical protein
VSDPGSQFDWDGIFDRAHRRLYVRLVLLSVVGGLIALLLLGGGLSTRGDLTWSIGPFASKAKKEKKGKVKVARKVEEALAPPPLATPSSAPNKPPPERKAKPNVPIVIPVPPPPPPPPEPEPCPQGDSSSEQYDDCLPQPTPADTGTTGAAGATGNSESGSSQNGGTEYVQGATESGTLSNATPEDSAAN